jgi:hypothetical protein
MSGTKEAKMTRKDFEVGTTYRITTSYGADYVVRYLGADYGRPTTVGEFRDDSAGRFHSTIRRIRFSTILTAEVAK